MTADQLQPPIERAPERDIPWELDAAVKRAMAFRPEKRYEMVNEMRSDIAAYLAGNLLQAADYTRWQTLRKWSERNKATVIAAVAIGLAVIATFTGIRWQLYKLQEERRRTVSMEKKVSKADQALKLKSEDFDRLADVQAMHELLTEAEALWPRRPRLIGRYQAWLKRAYNLASKEDTHRKTMARLKKLPQASKAQKALLSALTRLVSDIQTLKSSSVHGTTIAGLTARLALARQLSSRQESDSDIWARTNKDLRQLPAYRKFKKMKLAPIPGLVPIGPDRQSGLLEFAHLGTGTPPKFDARGRLVGTGNAGLILVLLPPGSFLMGAHPTTGSNRDPQALSREQPVRQVSLTTFLISKYEMTQAQWKDATGKNPSLYVAHQQYSREMIGPRNPVTDVDWNDATRVLGQLGLELPTEAQWEYAARAGMHTVWPQGNHPSDLQGRANLADRAAQQASPGMACNSALDDGRHLHAPVGSYPPNRWGLFDMTGNIREWCRDQMTSYRVQPRWGDGLRKDSSSRSRMLRGGSWACLPAYARSAGRYWTKPDFRNRDVGLRPVLNIRNLAPQHK